MRVENTGAQVDGGELPADELRLRRSDQSPHGRGRPVQCGRGEVHHGHALPLRGPVRRHHDISQTEPRLPAPAGPAPVLAPPEDGREAGPEVRQLDRSGILIGPEIDLAFSLVQR